MHTHLFFLYLIITLVAFLVLLGAFLSDGSTPKVDKLSWTVLVLGSVFWLIAIPLSFGEVLRKLIRPKKLAAKQNSSQ